MDVKKPASQENLNGDESESQISHLALDIGGSLIKVVYFLRSNGSGGSVDDSGKKSDPVLEGRLHFAKFETSKINDCLEFIRSKNLHLAGMYMDVYIIFYYIMCFSPLNIQVDNISLMRISNLEAFN